MPSAAADPRADRPCQLRADDAQINADTADSVTVAVARTVKLRLSGSGDVEIIGNPSCTIEGEGSGGAR